MKITREHLKSIVKECLVEILAEGIGAGSVSSVNEVAKKKQAPHHSVVARQNASRIQMKSTAINEAIKRESGGNNIMASILADTARNTLPTMLENDRTRLVPPSVGGVVERTVASHTPEELFGDEVASKWADLAFMGMPNK